MKKETIGTLGIAALAAVVLSVCLFRTLAVEAVYPVEKAKNALRRHLWTRFTGLFDGASAKAENVRLKREVATLAMAERDVTRLSEENARLREALGYRARLTGRWLAAEVLSRGGAAAVSDVIRVGLGSLSGVKVGAVVCVPEGVVGRVIAVTPHTSEVALVTDRSVEVACEIRVSADGGGARGLLSGGTSDMLVIRNLKGAAEVPPRSKVVTSGLGGVFPRGIEVGTYIGASGEDAGTSASEGEVLPSVDFSTLEDVFIRHEG